ncbi:hypothetical protein ACROYT_G017501 [Oculina patagonica]
MGSPVSAVIANLYMESFEEQAITLSSYKPKIWKRYVDDTFTILDREILSKITKTRKPSTNAELNPRPSLDPLRFCPTSN